ncbi:MULTISPECIES: RNA polymerase subunit Rpo13 [Acidianus]|uniref:RNA polymerase Rpo13 subunit HTH domain protein n=1 Tax=Candidatus Acidianus copahuensis TaxID=1160895 RepID=A0A031LJX8_9CREN|nr:MULTISPECIES: RNA polymerase subunit Rpo13 [Acidianus]EZQ03098.1 RNA polymerase Rpo13 subunit HTH domain protein [Candidatus Acidianus copahuensis]NON62475.1 RNA polymerase Rpo13 [Acidianus sp. RZ1]
MSDESSYEGKEEEEKTDSEVEERSRGGDDDLPAMSLQDIELLMKNTDVWYNLISGKISIEEAKKLFEENYETILASQRKKAEKKKSVRKSRKPKKKEGDENAI